MKPQHFDVSSAGTFSGETQAVSSTAVDRWMLGLIRQGVSGARLNLRLWDGFERPSTPGPDVATVTFRNRRALFGVAWHPELYFGEMYMAGALGIHGDLVAILEEINRARVGVKPRSAPRDSANSPPAARENVHHHYDLGNDFYKLWLDREMLYTCAYFPTKDATLEEAQIAKMDRVCRKLRLRPGERVVEAGCGWGSLALFMAQQYGVTVRAFNLSAEQIAYARDRARREGLADRVEFVEDDYRNVRGAYDAFVSVGMLEHVGLPDYEAFGRVIQRALTPSGRGLLHFIGRNRPAPLNPWIRRRIFPGAYPPTLPEVFERVLQPQELSVLDVENLRLHYAKTLEHWRRRFETATDRVADMFDERFVLAWRLYLAGSQAAFSTGWMQLFQVVFARGASNRVPWTRDVETAAFE